MIEPLVNGPAVTEGIVPVDRLDLDFVINFYRFRQAEVRISFFQRVLPSLSVNRIDNHPYLSLQANPQYQAWFVPVEKLCLFLAGKRGERGDFPVG